MEAIDTWQASGIWGSCHRNSWTREAEAIASLDCWGYVIARISWHWWLQGLGLFASMDVRTSSWNRTNYEGHVHLGHQMVAVVRGNDVSQV